MRKYFWITQKLVLPILCSQGLIYCFLEYHTVEAHLDCQPQVAGPEPPPPILQFIWILDYTIWPRSQLDWIIGVPLYLIMFHHSLTFWDSPIYRKVRM